MTFQKTSLFHRFRSIPILVAGGLFLYLLLFPQVGMEAVTKGFSFCITQVIPSIFPQMVIISILLQYNFTTLIEKIFPPFFKKLFGFSQHAFGVFLLGFLSGFPIGAKSAATLYRQGKCSKAEAEYLVCFCNNCSPAFLIGGIGIGMFRSQRIGIILYLSQVLATLLLKFFFKKIYSYNFTEDFPLEKTSPPFFSVIVQAIKDSALSLIPVGGYIVFFSVLSDVFGKIAATLPGKPWIHIIGTGFLELTSAANLISQTHFQFLDLPIYLISFFVGWSGFSVHMQTAAFLIPEGLSMKKYYGAKCIQGLLCTIFTILLISFFYR